MSYKDYSTQEAPWLRPCYGAGTIRIIKKEENVIIQAMVNGRPSIWTFPRNVKYAHPIQQTEFGKWDWMRFFQELETI